MASPLRLFEYRISSESADSNVASLASYGFAVLFMVCGVTRIASMQISEIDLVLATIGVVSLSMLAVVFGLLIELNQRLRSLRASKPESSART